MENKLEERRWEDLNTDCLVQIFTRLNSKTLEKSIRWVCKSWNNAAIDPGCWKTLVFSEYTCSNNFIKLAVGRSQGYATSIEFTCLYAKVSIKALTYISEGCPNLKTLHMPFFFDHKFLNPHLSDIFTKLKKLEVLKLDKQKSFIYILECVSAHCKKLVQLDIFACKFSEEDVSAIVHFTPKIKCLKLQPGSMLRSELIMILKTCRELEELDVNCYEFGRDKDDEILKLSSNIKFFKFDEAPLMF